jgi:SPP1 gp7 family putative phage head morphogenesis protein
MKIISIVNAKVGNPIIPRRADDPAAQFGNLRNANAQLNKRYTAIKRGVRELLGTFNPVVVSNEITTNAAVYEYRLDAQRYQGINIFLQQLIYGQLLGNTEGVYTSRWWLNANLTTAYTDGASDALQSSKNIASADVVGIEVSQEIRGMQLEQIVFSQGFQSRVGLIHARVFEEMKGLSDSSKTDLANTLARGMAKGAGIRELTKDVMKRIDVSHNRAIRIARTEILNAYRTASANETDELNKSVYDDSGWHMVSLWWSALSPTTRKTHAVKHGSTYTTQEVRDFYGVDGNAINCLCSQSPVLANKKTGEILQKPLQERMKKSKEVYLKGRGMS